MTWVTGTVVYLLIWWTALFAVLPWGVRHEIHPDPSKHSPGAPVHPQLGRKFIVTTLLSAIIWLSIYFLEKAHIIDFRSISIQMMREDQGK
jgi:predicted secreted protein